MQRKANRLGSASVLDYGGRAQRRHRFSTIDRAAKAAWRFASRRSPKTLLLRAFALLSPDIVAFCEEFSGKVVAQASRLCVPAKLSPVIETHGRDARATLLATFLWLRLCRAMLGVENEMTNV
jgi:hypothetical protein